MSKRKRTKFKEAQRIIGQHQLIQNLSRLYRSEKAKYNRVEQGLKNNQFYTNPQGIIWDKGRDVKKLHKIRESLLRDLKKGIKNAVRGLEYVRGDKMAPLRGYWIYNLNVNYDYEWYIKRFPQIPDLRLFNEKKYNLDYLTF